MNKISHMWNKSSSVMKLIVSIAVILSIYFLFFRRNSSMENFGNPSTCTYYYMEQCGHCKRFSPEWDNFVQSYAIAVGINRFCWV